MQVDAIYFVEKENTYALSDLELLLLRKIYNIVYNN